MISYVLNSVIVTSKIFGLQMAMVATDKQRTKQNVQKKEGNE